MLFYWINNMLQLEKIKNTIENNEKRIEYHKDGHKLDFFKTSTFIRPKKNKIVNFIANIFLLWTLSLLWNTYTLFDKNEKRVLEMNKISQVYSNITESLNKNNTLDINEFESLTKTSSGYGSLMSSMIVQKILLRERDYKAGKDFLPEIYKNYKKLDPQLTQQIFKIYSQNWSYGLEKEKQINSNCGIDAICHFIDYRTTSYYETINDIGVKNLAYIRYPDIFQKELELRDLQNKYQTYIK